MDKETETQLALNLMDLYRNLAKAKLGTELAWNALRGWEELLPSVFERVRELTWKEEEMKKEYEEDKRQEERARLEREIGDDEGEEWKRG